MPTSLLLVDNLFSLSQYPDHLITATEEAADHEAYHVGNGRRSALDYWIPNTANTDMKVQAAFGRVRAFNCLIIDRGHNLAGKTVNGSYWSSASSVGAPTYMGSTIPIASGPGSPDDVNGVTTEEGVFIKRFNMVAASNASVDVPAGGASFKPQIVGIYLGLCWTPPTPDFPWSEDEQDLISVDVQSDTGWIGSPRINNRRQGTLMLRLRDTDNYDQARLTKGLYDQRNPMWIAYDDQEAQKIVCAIRPQGSTGWRLDRDWTNKRRAEIPWIEHEPLAI